MKINTRKLRIILLRVLFAAYLYLLVKIILFKGFPVDPVYLVPQLRASLEDPLRIAMMMEQGNLIPFHEIGRTLSAMTQHGYRNLIGNIVIFVPFGLLASLLGAGRGLTVIGALRQSFILSLFLEMLQAVFAMGTFDVDDIILNSCGGLAGAIAGRFMVKSDTIIASMKKRRATD